MAAARLEGASVTGAGPALRRAAHIVLPVFEHRVTFEFVAAGNTIRAQPHEVTSCSDKEITCIGM